jgi:TldD protein
MKYRGDLMLDKQLIKRLIDKALANGADFAEIYLENTRRSLITLFDSKAQSASAGIDSGIGIRVFYGNKAIYAYTNDLSEESLFKAVDAVRLSGKEGRVAEFETFTVQNFEEVHPLLVYPDKVSKQEKIEFLHSIDQAARLVTPYISQVKASLSDIVQDVMIANSEGLWTEDQRKYVRAMVNAVASKGNEKQTSSKNKGFFAGWELIRSLKPDEMGAAAAETAVRMLHADYAPSGRFPVVIENAFGGVVFHEACGHALETTSVAKNASVFCGKLGQKIAHEAVTAIDDGTMPNVWGSQNVDDEGTPTEKTVLIEKGILKSYIVDKLGGLQMNLRPTGSGRRQNYRFAPASRMRNTYIAPGSYKQEELISSIDYGIYARQMGGGSVSTGTGDYNFAVTEGYIIRNGRIEEPVRGATLIGNGAETLHKISMVADNLELAEGMCGSVSGSVPTSVGQPAIKVDEIVVGGRK